MLRDSRAGVGDGQHDRIRFRFGPNGDCPAARGEFDGVAHDVRKDLEDALLVALSALDEADLRAERRWAMALMAEVRQHRWPGRSRAQTGANLLRSPDTRGAWYLSIAEGFQATRSVEEGTVLRIEVRGPQAPSWKKGQRTIRNARGPRDTYG